MAQRNDILVDKGKSTQSEKEPANPLLSSLKMDFLISFQIVCSVV